MPIMVVEQIIDNRRVKNLLQTEHIVRVIDEGEHRTIVTADGKDFDVIDSAESIAQSWTEAESRK